MENDQKNEPVEQPDVIVAGPPGHWMVLDLILLSMFALAMFGVGVWLIIATMISNPTNPLLGLPGFMFLLGIGAIWLSRKLWRLRRLQTITLDEHRGVLIMAYTYTPKGTFKMWAIPHRECAVSDVRRVSTWRPTNDASDRLHVEFDHGEANLLLDAPNCKRLLERLRHYESNPESEREQTVESWTFLGVLFGGMAIAMVVFFVIYSMINKP